MSGTADPDAAPSLSRHLQVIALTAGAFATLLGALTSIGWLLHVPLLVQIHPTFAPMVLATALSFVFTGLGLLALGVEKRFAGRVCGVVVIVIAMTFVTAYLVSSPTRGSLVTGPTIVDFNDPIRSTRMAPNTATAFLLVGLALALTERRAPSSRAFRAGGAAGIAVVALSMVAVVGYAFGIEPAFGWGRMIAMSPQTAAGLLFVGLAVVSVIGRPDLAVGRHRARWLALLAGSASATTTLLLWQALAADQAQSLQRRLDTEALSVRHALSLGLQLHVDALARLAHRWEHRVTPVREEWQDDAASYVRDFPGYEAVAWADRQARVRWVVPLIGNEKAVDRDLRVEERRAEAVDAARSRHGVAITRPVELLQGGRGFLALEPLSPDGPLGGFVVAGFLGARLLDSTLSAESRANHGLSLLLDGEALGFSAPASPLSKTFRARSDWRLLGREWSVEVVPTLAWTSHQMSALPVGALLGGLLFSGLLAGSVLKVGEARLANDQLVREVAERRSAELERDQFFSLSIDMLCISNRDGYFKRLNPAFEHTLGYTVAELTGRPFLDFVHPEDVATTLAEVAKQFAGGLPTMHFENRYLCKGGGYRWLAWTSMPDAKTGMMYALARDVTAQKGMEVERERLISKLQATLAQVRTLSSMLPMCSSCRRIQDDMDGSWNQLEGYLAKIKSGTQVSHGICPECMGRLYPGYGQKSSEAGRDEPS